MHAFRCLIFSPFPFFLEIFILFNVFLRVSLSSSSVSVSVSGVSGSGPVSELEETEESDSSNSDRLGYNRPFCFSWALSFFPLPESVSDATSDFAFLEAAVSEAALSECSSCNISKAAWPFSTASLHFRSSSQLFTNFQIGLSPALSVPCSAANSRSLPSFSHDGVKASRRLQTKVQWYHIPPGTSLRYFS